MRPAAALPWVAMDTLLRSQGKSSGTVAERAHALSTDPQYLYPNTEPGRQQILEYCNGLIKALQPQDWSEIVSTLTEPKRDPLFSDIVEQRFDVVRNHILRLEQEAEAERA